MEREFKGVWITKEIWLNENLGWTEKLLLVEVESLAKNGECFASNEYFARFFGLSKDRISKLLTSLNRKGFISVDLIYKRGTKQIDKRIITVNPIGENTYTPRQKCLDPLVENTYTPLGENAEDNNTSFNNTNNNTTNKRDINNMLISEFETLWKTYPRKIGKAKAQESYIKARKKKKVEYEKILEGLNRYIQYVEGRRIEEQFIMHGSTWFNQEKWLDEYTSIVPQPKTTNVFDFYKNEFDSTGDDFFDLRGDRKIIDDYTQLLSYPPQEF